MGRDAPPAADGLRVLVVDHAPPTSLRHGNALIGRNLFRRLGQHRLTIVAPVAPSERPEAEAVLRELFDEVHLVDRPASPLPVEGWARGGLPEALSRRWTGGISTAVRRLAARATWDVVHVRQLAMAPYGRRIDARGRLLELIDSQTLAARRDPASDLRSRLRRRVVEGVERRAVRGYDVVTVVAAPDADAIRALAPPTTRVHVVPSGVDAEAFGPVEIPEQRDSLVFVGAMSFPPNVAAVHHFVEDVLPLVQARRPSATFTIVGRDPVASIRALAQRPGVVVTGEVPDVRPYLGRAAIVVCPLVSGSSPQHKVLEAMAMARPVVASPLAVEGVRVVPGQDAEVAATAGLMASAILRLLADPGARVILGANGRRLVEERYAWEACAARYDALYRELAARSGGAGERRRRLV